MKNFRTYQLALSFYRHCQTRKIPNRELRDQFHRASLSIVLNLAEGSGKRTRKDRQKFYTIALGSLRETQALLEILNWTPEAQKANKIGAYLYKLTQNPGGQ